VIKNTYEETMADYENKNYINKMLFSMTYNKTKISNQEKQISHLIKEGRKHFDRKNEYKKEVSRLKDFEDKYTKLRRDFGKRLNNALGEVKVENEQLKRENNLLISENENLKAENAMAKYAVEFLSKLKIKWDQNLKVLKTIYFLSLRINTQQKTQKSKEDSEHSFDWFIAYALHATPQPLWGERSKQALQEGVTGSL
jgi:cell division protein FtsB